MNKWRSSVDDWLVCCSQLKYITQKSEEIASNNMEQKEKKKKKSSAAKGGRTSGEQEAAVTESEDSNMAWFTLQVMSMVIFSYYPWGRKVSLLEIPLAG